MREHRLYQADWLMRYYGFSREEIASAAPDGMLDLKRDPKLMWALANRDRFPVDVNRAEREMLLRIPGIGARSVDTLIGVRRVKAIRRHHPGLAPRGGGRAAGRSRAADRRAAAPAEFVLMGLFDPLIPANAGIQIIELDGCWPRVGYASRWPRLTIWVPAVAGMSGCDRRAHHDFIWLVVCSIWSAEVTTLEFIS